MEARHTEKPLIILPTPFGIISLSHIAYHPHYPLKFYVACDAHKTRSSKQKQKTTNWGGTHSPTGDGAGSKPWSAHISELTLTKKDII